LLTFPHLEERLYQAGRSDSVSYRLWKGGKEDDKLSRNSQANQIMMASHLQHYHNKEEEEEEEMKGSGNKRKFQS